MNESHFQKPNPQPDPLAQELLGHLSDAERRDLEALLGPELNAKNEILAQTAAAIQLADPNLKIEPMPSGLKERILKEISGETLSVQPRSSPRGLEKSPGQNRYGWVGWLVAACLLLALAWPAFRESPSVAKSLARLITEPTTKVARGQPLPNEETAGEVIWNSQKQEGFLRLANLPKLPGKQLQLWIFDAERDERYPVDGGVFDSPSGEVVIPIQAKLKVNRATMFAITVEPPGGVVVSERKRIVWLAKI